MSLGAQSPERGRQFLYNKSLDRANGDQVDYYTFTTDGRYVLGLGVRDQTIEWLQATMGAGTYYIRVETMEDGAA